MEKEEENKNQESEEKPETDDALGKGISEAVKTERKQERNAKSESEKAQEKEEEQEEPEEEPNYEFLENADVKFQAFGKTVDEAFSNALIAMFSSMYDGEVQNKYSHEVTIKGKNIENLLHDFLTDFLNLFKSKGIFVSNVRSIGVDLDNMEVTCEIVGDFAKNYPIQTIIKDVTYNEMIVREEKGFWVIQVVLDS